MNDYAVRDLNALESEASPAIDSPSSTWLRAYSHRRPHKMVEWMLVLIALIALLGAVGATVLLLGERDYTGRIYPNISIRGMNVGGYSAEAAQIALDRHYTPFLDHPVELMYGNQMWRPSAAELGISLDIDGVIQEAMTVGRDGRRITNAQAVAAAWEQGIELPLNVTIDQARMQHYLMDIAAAIETPPQNADVQIRDANVLVIPDQDGVQVLIDETVQDITAATQGAQRAPVDLRTRTLEATMQAADVAPVADEVQALLDKPIILTSPSSLCHPNCSWEWSRDQIAQWVNLKHTVTAEGGPTIEVEVDQTALRQSLLPIAEALREEGTLPRVNWNDGQLSIYSQGLPGRGLNAPEALASINEALYSEERILELPLTPIPPPVTEANLGTLGINTMIGVGSSSFRGSAAYRITNIRAGARRMHGILIPPGGSFSFNQVLGPVNAAGGFVEGLAIVNNRTQREFGGGLCQVSTTMFRAAFWTGLPITERHEHSFRIPWYEELGEPPGLDAAIFTGALDMRFVNDTGSWLLTQSWVDVNRQRLFISMFGSPINRNVSMSYAVLGRTPRPTKPVYIDDPSRPRGSVKQTDYAQGGMTLQVYRVVREGDTVLWQDTFDTTFKPWPNIYLRGVGRS